MTLAAPIDHRHRETAIAQVAHVSKYFSIDSLRPVKTQTVPLRPAAAPTAQSVNSAPSGVLMVPETTPPEPDWRESRRAYDRTG